MYQVSVDSDRLLRNLPPIKRTRFWRLYAQSGKRYLDLWMDGGRALLGAGGSGIGRVFKSTIDMGLTRPVPSHWEGRVKKQLALAWPDYPVSRLFSSGEGAFECANKYISKIIVLRPFGEYLEANQPAADVGENTIPHPSGLSEAAIPVLPCPSALAPGVLLFKSEKAAAGIMDNLVPPAQLAALSRTLKELDDFSISYTEKHWKRAEKFTNAVFKRKGPYLLPLYPHSLHNDYFLLALEAGLLISPDYDLPSIIPGEFDDGELVKLPKIG